MGHGGSTPVILALGSLGNGHVDDCSCLDNDLQAGLDHTAKAYLKEGKISRKIRDRRAKTFSVCSVLQLRWSWDFQTF